MIFRNNGNFRKSTLLLLLVALTIFVSLSAISATDVNNDTIKVCTFSNDGAAIDGGAICGKIYQDNGSIAVENFENSVNNIYLSDKEILGSAEDGTFTDLQKKINDASEGSTISLEKNYIYNSGFSTYGITINKVLTINGNGHTIDALGKSGIFDTTSTLTLDNVVFKNGKMSGTYGGGAIHAKSSLIITNSIFMDNSAYHGGAIYSSNDINVTNCIFKNNKADGSGSQQCKGGAIYSNKKVEVDNSTFTGNYAHDYGGAIYADTVHTNSKSYFINNVAADNDGGAIYTQSVYIVETVFDGNSACRIGGAIFNTNGITAKNSTFRNNKAEGASVLQCHGGAIYVEKLDGRVIVNNCTFIANHAADYGGAITGFAAFDVSSSIFIDNSAGDNCGGAIYAKKSGATGALDEIKIVNSIFEGNHAYDDGGAIFTTSTNVNVKNSTFRNNYAEGASASQCHGGAIASETNADYGGNCILKIDNSTFIGNHAYDYGGAIYADIISWVNTPSYFINNYVNDNQGGAIYTNKFNTDVTKAVFIGNQAKANDDGGAIYINKANTIKFAQCYFEKNKCGDEGGAIYMDSRSSVLSLKYNVFVDNSAGDKGQIVYNCGKYSEISDNWYGTNTPNFKDQFKEWKFFKDNDHSDSNHVITKLSLNDNPRVGQTYALTVDFLSKNSAKLSDKLFGFDAKFSADNGAEISNHQIGTNNVTSDITFRSAGLTTVTATVNNQVLKLSYNPSKENVTMNITAPEISVGENATVKISFTPNTAAGTVTVGDISSNIENGVATVIIPNLSLGNNTLPVVYSGDRAYNPAQDSVTIVVNRKDLNISASAIPIYVGDNATVVVTGLEDATGNVAVTIGDNIWSGEITNGTASVVVTGLTDNVTANVTYRGDNNHNNASTTVDIVVNE
ncbi:right-handed parallel beta-helix repeat-containing protein, partial [Methanobrevibacter sp.]|uniref:Ig-like domain-containing protein n=1 Tax=Methanobrevibacter sp. TaxID=66852 RepID=UPI00388E76CD